LFLDGIAKTISLGDSGKQHKGQIAKMNQKSCQIMSKFCNDYYIQMCSAILMTSKSWDVVLNEKYGHWES